MEEQVGIVHPVHASVGKQALDMLTELVAHTERVMELFYKLRLLCRQAVGIFRIDGGERVSFIS